jgi:hypothetical protein
VERDSLSKAARDAFSADAAAEPAMSLRSGAAVDRYDEPPAFDPELDRVSDEYLEKYAFDGLTYLDAASWRHYLPALIEYAIASSARPGMVIEGLIWSLRPPDRVPPRLGSLTPEQEAVMVELLERVAFGDRQFAEQQLALQVLEEWWIPGALYRPSQGGDA